MLVDLLKERRSLVHPAAPGTAECNFFDGVLVQAIFGPALEEVMLTELLDQLPQMPMIPSVYLSVASRTSSFVVREVDVASRERRGDSADGSTWGKSALAFMPSRRLVTFVLNATMECHRTIGQLRASQTSNRAQ